MADEPKKPSPLEQLKQLDEELKQLEEQRAKLAERANKIRADAEAEIMARAHSELAEIGKRFEPVKKAVRKTDPTKKCPICKIRTDPWHDGRWHKTQDVKKPFTDKELKEKGLRKVESDS